MSIDFSNFGTITRLVLSGGGPRGLAILGALQSVYENGGLDNIKEYWGTSVGSVISLLLLIGYTPFDAFHQFFMTENLADPNALDIQSILEESAFCPIELFGDKVRHFVQVRLGKDADPTFADLYEQFGKKIHIMGANLDTMSGECFDVDSRPDMKVIEAIEISCDLPYIFTKKKFEGHTYVDGGFINNYAVDLADNGIDYCLGICAFGDVRGGVGDFVGWIYKLLHMPIRELHRERVSRLSNRFINIELLIDGISMIEMSPDQKKKIQVFSLGYRQAKDYLRILDMELKERKIKFEYTQSQAQKDAADWDWDSDWSEESVNWNLLDE